MAKLLPIILLIIGLGGGIGAGFVLRPEPTEVVDPCAPAPGEDGHAETKKEGAHEDDAPADITAEPTVEFIKMNNQFVVPMVSEDMVDGMVVMSLSLEIAIGMSEYVFRMEPKLRDAFLQVLFDHANIGGFRGAFTNSNTMDVLRGQLLDTAQGIVGDTVSDVLITDIARQDI